MVLFVVTSLQTTYQGYALHATAQTDLPCHLHLGALPQFPPQLPKYRTRQGRTYQCGWSFNWQGALCAEQNEPALTTTHTFLLDALSGEDGYHYTLSECCPATSGCASTPPIPAPENESTILDMASTQPYTIPAGATQTIQQDSLLLQINYPPPLFPSTSWIPPSTGPTVLTCSFLFTATEDATITCQLFDETTATVVAQAHGEHHLFGNLYTSDALVLGTQIRNHAYSCRVRNDHPNPITFDGVGGGNFSTTLTYAA